MKVSKFIFAGLVSLMLSACESDKSDTLQGSVAPIGGDSSASTFSGFNPDPNDPNLPFPINILFSGTFDLTLNIPLAGSASDGPRIAMNALDGFSTVAPITSGAFTGALDPDSFATAVRVFEVTLIATLTAPIAGPVATIVSELTFGEDFIATLSSIDTEASNIVILPLKPLKPKTSYYVVIDSNLKDAGGNSVGTSSAYLIIKGSSSLVDENGVSQSASLTDNQAVALEPLRVITNTSEAAVAAASITPSLNSSDIILSWSFTTQSVGDVLTVVRSLVNPPVPAPASAIAASTVDLDGPGPLPAGLTSGVEAVIFEGTIDIPYYLTAPIAPIDPTPLGSVWTAANPAFTGDTEMNLTQFNPLPASTSTVTVPVLITRPIDVGTFPPPWKTVIFQHGITRSRTDILTVADSFAAIGFAVVAIDMPMHGVTGDEVQGPDGPSPGAPSPVAQFKTANERTFDLDIAPVSLGAGGVPVTTQDGMIDPSGTHFINLANLRNSRDNVRQSVADLFAVMAAIPTMDIGGGGDSLDSNNVYFLGHSLGAIVGTVFTALEPNIKDAVFAFGGGAVPKFLDGSASFGPVIAGGLAANGVIKGTADYETFLIAAQTAFDSGDPINYGAAAAAGHNILFFEIAGSGSSPSDLVVPNRVPDANDTSGTVPAPLAGTEPLVGPAVMNLTPTKTTGVSGDLFVRFNAGHHNSLLTSNNITGVPTVAMSAEVFVEIQSEIQSYIGSGTATLTISNPDLLVAP